MESLLLEIIGKRLKELRIRKGLTQEKLAHQCQTDPSYIRKVEAGKVNISIRRLHKIIAQFDLQLSEFFEDLDNLTEMQSEIE